MERKYRRMNQHGKIAGVCSGLAYHFGVQTWVVRLIMLVLVLGYGVGLLPYFLVALLAPKYDQDPADYQEICE